MEGQSFSEFDPMKEAGTGGDGAQGFGAATHDSESNRDSLDDFEKVDAEQLRQIDQQLDFLLQKPKSFEVSETAVAYDGPDVALPADPSLPPVSGTVKSETATGSSLLELDPFDQGYQREKETSLLELAPESEVAPKEAAGPATSHQDDFIHFEPSSTINQTYQESKIENIPSALPSDKNPEAPAGLPYELSYQIDPSLVVEESIPSKEHSPATELGASPTSLRRELTPPPMEPIPQHTEQTPPPKEPTPPPREPTPPPRQQTPPPLEPTPLTKEPTSPPMELTPLPREPTPPPREPTPPPKELTPPPKEPTPPPREPTPPPKEPTPPPKEPTPPPRMPTPPPREPTPPPSVPTPPLREPTPPPKEPTPPPKELTPPPKEPTPPPKEPTPPPKEPTPPPTEPTLTRENISVSFVNPAFPEVEQSAGALSDFVSSFRPVQEATISQGPPATATSRKAYTSDTNSSTLCEPVVNLIYWRDVKKSGIVFGSIMVVLLSLAYLSLISVVAYTSLTVLTGTIAFRIYKNIMQAIQKSQDGHPFKQYLELDTSLQSDKVHEATDIFVSQINSSVTELKRLFLVEDLIDSVKFGCLLWCLTYVGSWFNGLTLVILSVVALFSLPKVYEQNQAQIDQYLGLVRTHFNDIVGKVKAAIPVGAKEKESKEKDQ